MTIQTAIISLMIILVLVLHFSHKNDKKKLRKTIEKQTEKIYSLRLEVGRKTIKIFNLEHWKRQPRKKGRFAKRFSK